MTRPESVSPLPRMILMASVACSVPTIPQRMPSTPASWHDGASSGGGGSGYQHR